MINRTSLHQIDIDTETLSAALNQSNINTSHGLHSGRLSKTSEHVIASVVLILALVLFYRDVVFRGHTFLILNQTYGTMPISQGGSAYHNPQAGQFIPYAVGDPGAIAWQTEPYNRAGVELIQKGELPLWNRNTGLGGPLAADSNSALFEPLRLLSYLIPLRFWPVAEDVQVLLRYFLGGLFTYLFARRLNLSLAAALVAGVAYMLSGYFVQFGNHPHIRAELLLPMLLYTYDRLVSHPKLSDIIIGSLITAWVLLNTFPQSSFLAVVLAICWYLFKAVLYVRDQHYSRSTIIQITLPLIGVLTIGFALSAFQLLPIAENVLTSLHVHGSGVGLRFLPSSLLLTMFTPQAIANTSGGWHFYSSIMILAIIGVILGISTKHYRAPTLFFAIYAFVFILKIFGVGVVQWIGLLPVFTQISIFKYIIPSIWFCVVLLAAISIDLALISRYLLRSVFVGIFLFIVLFLFSLWLVPKELIQYDIFSRSIMIIASAILAVTLVLLAKKFWRRGGPYIAWLAVVVVLIEPNIWHRGLLRPIRYDPYTTPPFVTFLRKDLEPARVIGLDGITYPEIPAAYNIDDVRYLHGLISQRRYLYFTQFMSPSRALNEYILRPGDYVSTTTIERIEKDLSEPSVSDADLINETVTRLDGIIAPLYLGRYFDLLNGTYILTPSNQSLPLAFNVINLVYDRTRFEQPLSKLATIEIDGDRRQSVFLHPPAQVELPITLPAGRSRLEFGVGIDPAVLGEGSVGDGVRFTMSVIDEQGSHTVFDRYIDPKHNMNDRHWFDESVDMTPWSGKRVTVLLASGGGPVNDILADWAYWSVPILHLDSDLPPWALTEVAQVRTLSLEQPIYNNNLYRVGPEFKLFSNTIDGDHRDGLFMHPNTHAALPVHLPLAPARLQFGVGMIPESWDNSDGVQFQVAVLDRSNKTIIFDRTVNPGTVANDRRWIDADIDLARWSGQTVTLQFSTTGGGNNNSDWATWGKIRLSAEGIGAANPEMARFELVYNDEIAIYRNRAAFPRAFVVHGIELSSGVNDSIRRLTRPDFDLTRVAVVEGRAPAGWQSDPTAVVHAAEARVVEYHANSMLVEATLKQPGLLVVSDAYDPNWQALVDGKPAEILPTNLVLRGIFLSSGTHTIQFTYASRAYQIGAIISAVAGILLLGGMIFLGIRMGPMNTRR